jgi:hypothetical protein
LSFPAAAVNALEKELSGNTPIASCGSRGLVLRRGEFGSIAGVRVSLDFPKWFNRSQMERKFLYFGLLCAILSADFLKMLGYSRSEAKSLGRAAALLPQKAQQHWMVFAIRPLSSVTNLSRSLVPALFLE